MARAFVIASSQFLEFQGTPPISAYPCSAFCWMQTDTTAVTNSMFMSICASGSGQYIGIGRFQDAVRLYIADNAGEAGNSSHNGLTTNTWYAIGAKFTGGSDNRSFKNGVSSGDINITKNFPASTNRVVVGRISTSAPDRYHGGRIAHAAWWNVGLTDAEFAALGAGRVHPYSVRPDALVFYCPVDGVVSPEPDLTAGQRVMTVTGATVANNPPMALWVPYGPEVSLIAAAAPPAPTRRNLTLLGVS